MEAQMLLGEGFFSKLFYQGNSSTWKEINVHVLRQWYMRYLHKHAPDHYINCYYNLILPKGVWGTDFLICMEIHDKTPWLKTRTGLMGPIPNFKWGKCELSQQLKHEGLWQIIKKLNFNACFSYNVTKSLISNRYISINFCE